MKKYLRVLMIAILILLSTTLNGEASTRSPLNIILEGDNDGKLSISSDIFLEYKNMLPGDTGEGTITIKNSYKSPIKIYMRAERKTEYQEYDLLDVINIKLHLGDDLLYEGPMKVENGSVYLGEYEPQKTKILKAEIELDGKKTTSEYRDKYVELDWIFTMIRDDKDTETDGGNDNDDNNESVVSPEKPPKTGDNSMLPYIGMATISVVGLVLNNTYKKK